MRTAVTDDVIKILVGSAARRAPLVKLEDTGDAWQLDGFAIYQRKPGYTNGWGFDLRPDSRFYKRWFDFPDLGLRGWAIIFRIFDPVGEPTQLYEHFPGWVPPEREAEADHWIAFLNGEIQARLREAAAAAKPGA